MIVRERDKEFVMIEQHHHALIAKEIMQYWVGENPIKSEVSYAIGHHDCGWINFDVQPFWNDAEDAPYDFINFPILPKLVLYQNGIDAIEIMNPYAALLCSKHYSKFVERSSLAETMVFLENEENRRTRLKKAIPFYRHSQFKKDYDLLKFADNLSLYICLHEPAVERGQEHMFFNRGIPMNNSEILEPAWDADGIRLSPHPFSTSFTVCLKQKVISKQRIRREGLLKSYAETPSEEVKIRFLK